MNYIGSKHSLLDFIEKTILDFLPADFGQAERDGVPMVFCDMFAGTSAVGRHFKRLGYNIISNDLQYYSYVLAKHYIENSQEPAFTGLRQEGIDDPFVFLDSIEGKKGFIYENYSAEGTRNGEFERLYFDDGNAMKIDAIRQKIEQWREEKNITSLEYFHLLASLLEAADRVANTASIYEAYLKKLKSSAQRPLTFSPLETVEYQPRRQYYVFNKDANELVRQVKGDILYLDPPYNTRKYNTNYHILETIALYDNPEIKGKTGMRSDKSKYSKYSAKREATAALNDLIKKANFSYIFLSYNDEGIISIDKIEEIMSTYGKYQRYEQNYRRFKADNQRDYARDFTVEYIHCVEKK